MYKNFIVKKYASCSSWQPNLRFHCLKALFKAIDDVIEKNNLPETVTDADVLRGMVDNNHLVSTLMKCSSEPRMRPSNDNGLPKGMLILRQAAGFKLKNMLADWLEKHDIACKNGQCYDTMYVNTGPKFYDYSNDEKKILRDEL